MDIFKIIGALGILIIAIGILIKKRKSQDIFYIAGGVCLEVYSIQRFSLYNSSNNLYFVCDI